MTEPFQMTMPWWTLHDTPYDDLNAWIQMYKDYQQDPYPPGPEQDPSWKNTMDNIKKVLAGFKTVLHIKPPQHPYCTMVTGTQNTQKNTKIEKNASKYFSVTQTQTEHSNLEHGHHVGYSSDPVFIQ
jgi:hypothetical protein